MRNSLVVIVALLAGCTRVAPRQTKPPTTSEGSQLQYVESVDAMAAIPVGWHPDPLKKSEAHTHQVWISPSGHCAYGIIHFNLPLPVGHELALLGFLQNMKKTEG